MQLRRLISEIPVADAQRAVAFYRDHLGFEVIHQEAGYAMLERDEQRLDIAEREGSGIKLWLVVSDIRALHRQLSRTEGVEVSALVPREYWVWECELTDPDGTLLVCVQPPPAPGLDVPELFEAIGEGDDDTVAELVADNRMLALETRGFYWGWGTRDDWTALQVAAGAGSPYVLELLLEAGADPTGGDRPDDGWWSPLHLAALRNPELVDRLASAGAQIDACTAAAMGQLDKLEPLDAHAAGSGAATPLHFAAGRGQIEVVKWLLERGASKDTRDVTYDRTPLEWAEWADEETRSEVEALLS